MCARGRTIPSAQLRAVLEQPPSRVQLTVLAGVRVSLGLFKHSCARGFVRAQLVRFRECATNRESRSLLRGLLFARLSAISLSPRLFGEALEGRSRKLTGICDR